MPVKEFTWRHGYKRTPSRHHQHPIKRGWVLLPSMYCTQFCWSGWVHERGKVVDQTALRTYTSRHRCGHVSHNVASFTIFFMEAAHDGLHPSSGTGISIKLHSYSNRLQNKGPGRAHMCEITPKNAYLYPGN